VKKRKEREKNKEREKKRDRRGELGSSSSSNREGISINLHSS